MLLRVADDGSGIAPEIEIEHKLFEPFTTTKPAARGPGLAVAHTLVEAAGGQIEAHIARCAVPASRCACASCWPRGGRERSA